MTGTNPFAEPARPPLLRTQLFRVLLAVAAVPVLIVSLMDAQRSYRIREISTAGSTAGRASAIQRRIDDYIDRHTQAVDALARIVPPEHRRNPAVWREAIRTFRENYPGFLTMLVANQNGNVMMAIRPDGALVRSPGAGDVGDREYFRRAMQSPEPFVSGTFRGRGLGTDPLVAVARAYVDTAGKPAGIVEGSLDLQKLRQFAAEYSNRSTAIVIVDGANRVAYSSPSLPFAPLQDLSSTSLVRRQAATPFAEREGTRNYIVAQSAGGSHYGWKVFVFEPASNFGATMLDWLRNLLAGLGAGTLLCLVVARMAALRVTRPLEHLAASGHNLVEAVAEGREPDMRLPQLRAGAAAEIAELHRGLEFMTSRMLASHAQLRRMNDELELRVAQRTDDLNRNNAELQLAMRRKTEAEAELVLFQRAVAAASEGITISDALAPDQPLVYVNPAFETLTGYHAADVLGRNCRFLQGAGADPAAVAEIRGAILERRPCVVELLNMRKDGRTFWNRLSITPIHSADGAVTHFVGVQVDITHHKEIEQLKNDLISTVSHELRTPLTSLYGFAELMLTRDFPQERMRRFLHIIHRESRRLTELVNDFLDLERIAAGRERFHTRPMAIERVVREAAQLFSTGDGDHTLRLQVNQSLPLVSADGERVRQVLDNLLSNARKFSPRGSAIELSATEGVREVVISVRDRGIGIPEEALPKLFTRFFRVDNTATRKIGGTGLGLELSKRLVEGQRGRIWVSSRVGEGSTFSFSLPLAPLESVETVEE
ncbi:MAG: PAS domain-containing protein [Acidobacteriia bacterium]|nr:PAS domain-containing protein [Terriglobia bacterium]